jgi:hypothetical protein
MLVQVKSSYVSSVQVRSFLDYVSLGRPVRTC